MTSDIKESDLEEKTLVCKECGNKFLWTTGEQKFFLDKGLQNVPKRCKVCAAEYKNKLREKHPLFWIKCADCGKKAEVSFEPKTEKVYCEDCFHKRIEERNRAIVALGETVPE